MDSSFRREERGWRRIDPTSTKLHRIPNHFLKSGSRCGVRFYVLHAEFRRLQLVRPARVHDDSKEIIQSDAFARLRAGRGSSPCILVVAASFCQSSSLWSIMLSLGFRLSHLLVLE